MTRKQQVSFALTSLTLGLTLPTPGAVRADHDPVPVSGVDTYVQTVMQSRNVPGVAVAVARGSSILLDRSYGLANVELKAPTSPGSVFEIGTLSKQFTAAAVMLLVEEGKIALNDPILTLMPDLPEAWGPVTVRHLLTHTSGIPNYVSVPGFFAARASSASPTTLIASVANLPLQFQPGEKWQTSSTDYLVLGRLIERVSGMSYSRFLTERIFMPLSLGRTRVNDHSAIIENRVTGYSRNQDGHLRNIDRINPTRLFASASIASTAGDLAKWGASLAGGKLLKPSSLLEMWTPTRLKDGTPTQYGFGWFVNQTPQGTIIQHGGGSAGFRTQIVRFAREGITVVVCANSDQPNTYAMAEDVHRLFARAPVVGIRE